MRRLSRIMNAALSPIYVQQRCWAEAASISAPLMSHKYAFLLPSSRHRQIIVDTKTRGYSSDHTRQGPAPTMPSLHSTPGTEHAASSPPPATTSQERDSTRDLPPPERVHAEAAPQQHWLDRRAPSVRQWLQSKSLDWWLRGVQARCRYAMPSRKCLCVQGGACMLKTLVSSERLERPLEFANFLAPRQHGWD